MNKQKIKLNKKLRRKHRVRAKIIGTASRPRLSVFRSLEHIYGQLVNDEAGKTLVSASDRDKEIKKLRSDKMRKSVETKKTGNIGVAYQVGELVAKKAIKKGIKQVVFDRGGYKYHGRVKALADGARDGGLRF